MTSPSVSPYIFATRSTVVSEPEEEQRYGLFGRRRAVLEAEIRAGDLLSLQLFDPACAPKSGRYIKKNLAACWRRCMVAAKNGSQ